MSRRPPRWTWLLACIMALGALWAPRASAAPFNGDGLDYVIYVRGYLWIFARQANTSVTVTNLATGTQVSGSPFTLTNVGQLRRIRLGAGSNSNNHYRVVATKPVTVGTGEVNPTGNNSDGWATYLTANGGTRLGKTFHGWTSSTVSVFCHKSGAVTPSGRILDVSDQGGSNDDSVSLTLNNATLNTSDLVVWGFTNFDQDQIQVTTSTDCSVLVGHNLTTRDDWSVTPPSVDPSDKGRSYGKKFYLFVHRQMAIVPTETNTRVTIRDLTTGNGNKSKPTFTLNLNQFYTPFNMASQSGVSLYNGYTNVHDNNVLYNNDIVEVTADKPVWVYSGPVVNDVAEHSVTAMPLPVGGGKQEAFCFVQNGVANDIQILSGSRQSVTITTMAGRGNHSQTIGLTAWSGSATGPNWWQSGSFNRELIRIRSAQPIWVLCGDLDQRSWMSYATSIPQNRPPVITVQGGTTKTVQATTNLQFKIDASDPDNDTLTWVVTGLPVGATLLPVLGNSRTFNWTPLRAQVGSYTVTIRVTDNGSPNLTTTQTITINVTAGPNRPPAFTSTAPTAAVENQPYAYTAVAVDPDGHTVTYSLRSGPTGAAINPTTGVLTWTPGDADGGQSRSFTIRACDNQSPPLCVDQTWTVNVTNVNDPPKITSTPSTSATEGQAYGYNPTVSDPDPGDSHTWSFKGTPPSGMTINPSNGQIQWTPSAAQGGQSLTVEIEVCDQANACDTQRWTINVTDVNSPPRITSTPPTTALERRLYSYNPTVVDPDANQTHTWSLVTKPATATINASNGQVRWTPSANDANKNFNFTIRVCDQGNLCDTQSWVVRVQRANTAPTITTTPPATATENTLYTYNPAVTDPDPLEQHTWKLTQGPTGATIDTATGAIKWTPGPSDSGKTVSFEIEVCDRANACVKQTWTVTVKDINNPPRITSSPSMTATEKQAYNYKPTATDADPGDKLTWKIKNGPTGATIDATTGEIKWTPDSSQGGKTEAFEIEVCDDATPPACDTQRWNVTVTNVNDPPTFTSTPPTRAVENQAYAYQPQISDPDPNETHTFKKLKGPAGLTVDPNTGEVKWTPSSADSKKTFDVEIEVCDSAGACAKQTWTITVTDVNNPPVITSTAPTTATEDQAYNYKPTATDADPGDTLTWKKTQGPANMTVDPNTGEVKWTPDDADATAGNVTVEIEVCDSAGACTKQSWTVAVTNVNDPPKITSTAPTSANEGKVLTYNATAIDPDPSETLTWSLVQGHGNAAIDASTGVFTWTPTAADAAAGSRSFEIKVCDKAGACDTQTFTVTVKEKNVAPKITSTAPTTAYVAEDLAYQATATDANAADKLAWKIKKGPSGATIDPTTGLLNWKPDPNDAGKQIDFEIEVCDDATPPECDTQSFTVTVRQKCRVDLDCKGQEICVQQGRFRVCIDPGCANKSPKCSTAGDFCSDGKCGKDICPTANCKDICHPVKGCIDSCAGVTCQTGERCIDGKCQPSPCVQTACQQDEICDTSDTQKPTCIKDPCGQGTCKHGRICDQGTCIDDPCLTGAMTCPQGQRCFAGQCLDPQACTIDIDCSGDKVCEQGKCVDPGCYPKSPQCSGQGELCRKTTCKADPCDGKTCASGEFCRDGVCIKACPSCNAGEKCVNGACITDPCANKSCGADQVCNTNGQCVADRCNTPNPCKYGRVCDALVQACKDDPCAGVTCPQATQICVAGECVDNPKPCQVDKDCPGKQLCVGQRCVAATCPPCPNNGICVNGQCVTDACAGVNCPTGQYCYGGQCVDPCASVSCPERCQFGQCVPDPCKGKQCAAGEICDNGACVKECCAADSCKDGRICRACACHPDLCASITCPQGTKCDSADGQCKGDQPCPDQTDAECPGDQVCIAGSCKPSDCYQNGCAAGKFCSQGQCVDNPCASANCAADEFCKPTDGQCYASCPSCPKGEKCDPSAGNCIADPCDGKTCAQGERCDDAGNCVADKCVEPNNGLCKFQRNCEGEKCSDRPCEGITCPTGQTCRSGICYQDQTTPEVTPENPSEQNEEDPGTDAGETTADATPGDSTVDGTPGDGTDLDGAGNDNASGDGGIIQTVGGGCGCDSSQRLPLAPIFLLALFLALPFLRRRRAS